MLNVKLGDFPIGPEGKFGSVEIAFVEGKLVATESLSLKGALDEAAKAIGGDVAVTVATFLEGAVGLS